MAASEATLLRRDRLVVATTLAVLAAIVLAVSYIEFSRSVGGPTRNGYHFGTVDLLTDDPLARAKVSVRFSADYSDYITDSPLAIDVALTSSHDKVAFALILSNDAARTGIQTRSTSVLPQGERRGDGVLWVQGDAVDAWFVNSAGPTSPESEPAPLGAVVVGHALRSKQGEPIRISMVIPTTGDFVRDIPTGFEFYMPRVGSREGWFQDQVLRARTNADVVIAPAANLIEAVDWVAPAAVDAEVVLSGLRENDRVDATPAASRADRGERRWQALEPIEVTGVLDRAEDIRQAQQRQFLAGAAVGLGGALLVWSLEVFLEVSLDARRSRHARRSTHKEESD